MDDKTDRNQPAGTEAGTRLAESGRRNLADRQQRQADALRANLRRRKEQQRDRLAPKLTSKAPGKPSVDET